jgi:predicted nucleic acid-binding protein
MQFVLDNSISMRWLFCDGTTADLLYADRVLKALELPENGAVVPGIWPLEVANVMSRAEARGQLTEVRSAEFLRSMNDLAIDIDENTVLRAWTTTLQLARRFKLTSYDAAYLELAQRRSLPIATLDVELRRAASQANVAML